MAAPIDLLIGTANKVAEILGFNKVIATDINSEITKLANQGAKAVATFVFDPKKIEDDADKAVEAIKSGNTKLQNTIDGFTLQQQSAAKAAAEKAAAEAKAAEEKAKALRDKQFEEDIKRRKEENDAYIAENADAVNQLGAIRDEELEKERQRKREEADLIVFQTGLQKENTEAKKKIKEEEFAHNQLLLNATANGLEVVSDLIGKNTAAGKATAVAAALINTYAAIAGQLRAFAGVPIPGYAIVQAVATGLAGFAAVKNILKVQVPNGGGGGAAPAGAASGGISAATPPAPPQFNVVGTGGVNQVAQAFSNNQQQPIKAYVVSNDVTTAQSLDRNIVKSASLG